MTHTDRSRRLGRLAVAGWTLATLVTLGLSAAAAGLVLFGASTTCGEPATSAVRWLGLRDLVVVAGVLALPWALVAVLDRRHGLRPVVLGAIGISPLLLAAVTHLGTGSWVGSFCF